MSATDSNGSPSAKRPLEMTAAAIILGIVLSVVMGAANVYLGLKVGMTVSASIPAAVVATGILRGILRRHSLLESNLVQTAASAGESLAAGIIFTMPAMILIGAWTEFDYWTTSLIGLAGGLLGILLMIPMRRVFIVDNDELKFPEGVACAEVLRAGDDVESDHASAGLMLVVGGILMGTLFKVLQSLVGVLRSTVESGWFFGKRVVYLGADMSPALVGVGFIVGLPISFQVFLGGCIGWLIAMPMLEPDLTALEASATAGDHAWELWKTQVRYIGVGAMVVGGGASIWKVRNGLASAVKELAAMLQGGSKTSKDPSERNLSMAAIAFWGVLCIVAIGAIYFSVLKSIPLTLMTTVAMFALSFFMAAVASYIVGLVGNSNSPVSGMTIMAVLATGLLLMVMGYGGQTGQVAILVVAGIVCCVACTSGDVCNDLKTGHLVGATPRSQQIMQVIGVLAAAFVLAPVLTVLHKSYGIGSKELSAPQAGLFASLARGFSPVENGVEGEKVFEIPMNLVWIGVVIGIALLVADYALARAKSNFRLYVMPVAVGIYLPFGVAPPMLLGGLLSWLILRARNQESAAGEKRGVLIASGIIAGESLMGVTVGFIAFFGVDLPKLGDRLAKLITEYGVSGMSILLLLGVASSLYFLARVRKPSD